MKQVLQSYRTGKLTVADVPAPGVEPGCVLVQTSVSLVSVGTERAAIALGKKTLLGKARERPDLVRKVLDRVSRDGLVATGRAVFDKLDQANPLGYSCVGRVIAVGEGVADIVPGDRVACAGAKVANHAEVNLVQKNLCTRVPDGVSDDDAAFVTVGAIALQGMRIAAPTLGETFAVIGLGLIGQIAAQLARAAGCQVIGIDLDAHKVELARTLGCTAALERGGDVVERVRAATHGRGVDGVLITAATSSNDPVVLAGELCRDRGRVVVVGAVGMEIPRRPYYDKELSFHQSRSYGPGRYDAVYEELGVDYPIGYVRWTEQRNMEAFLDTCAAGRMQLAPLVTHRFPIADAERAYELIGDDPSAVGVLLTYPSGEPPPRSISLVASSPPALLDGVRVGVIGAGNFASGVLIPAIAEARGTQLVDIASNRGITAQHVGRRFGFQRCTTDADAVFANHDVDAVFIATRHHLHAEQTVAALKSGKHVFVEKPLALDEEGLRSVIAAQQQSGRTLMVGFNRRYAPLAIKLREFFAGRTRPIVVDYRVNAGEVPADSWLHDPATGGGRILGECCHFIDFASFLCEAPVVSVLTRGVGASGGARSDDNVVISMALADGSLATVTYVATSDGSAGKERIEVLGDGATAVLEDFRVLRLRRNGKEQTIAKLAQDKGHRAGVAAFLRALQTGAPPPIPLDALVRSMHATFAAHASVGCGQVITPAS